MSLGDDDFDPRRHGCFFYRGYEYGIVIPSGYLSITIFTLGKGSFSTECCGPRCVFFVECFVHCTRQRNSLPSVTLGKVTRNPPFIFVFIIPSKQTKHISHSHHIYITKFIELSHISQKPQISHVFHKHKYNYKHKYHKDHKSHKFRLDFTNIIITRPTQT